ncbi:MAG TPA: hypothetical protein VG797_09605 [Phycisphaerales bacterium]|nr:hypothetical protein [Phycisphaerales bacterium]
MTDTGTDQPANLAARVAAVVSPRFLPWWVSIGLHALLIVSGFFIVWSATHAGPPPKPPVIVSFDEPAPVRLTADEPADDYTREEAKTAALPRESAAPSSTLKDLAAKFDTERPLPTPRAPTNADERARLASEQKLPEVRFAGVGASNAESIIYVVDASGSMVSTFKYVLARLERSVEKLASTQRFQVIFFQRGDAIAAPHPEDDQTLRPKRLIRASRDNVRAVMTWARSVTCAGMGDPIKALQTALALKPDAVFVLSSATTSATIRGLDKEKVLDELDRLNPVDRRTGRRDVMIKTIQFMDPDPAEILKSIGEKFGGGAEGYKFIGPEEVNKP